MRISIFCSANDLAPQYTEPAKQLAIFLATAGHTIVYGGVDLGLMKVVADNAQAHGGKLVGISMRRIAQFNRPNLDELIVADDVAARKNTLLTHADAVIVLVGGLGTLDELTEAMERKRHGKLGGPIIVLNSAGFYDGLQAQLRRIEQERLLPATELGDTQGSPLEYWVTFSTTPEAALASIEAYSQAR